MRYMVSGFFGYAVLNFAIFFFQAPQGGPRRKSSGSGGVARLLLPLDVLLLGCAGYPIRGYRWLRGPILSHCQPVPSSVVGRPWTPYRLRRRVPSLVCGA